VSGSVPPQQKKHVGDCKNSTGHEVCPIYPNRFLNK
jgi:hypothetical protein